METQKLLQIIKHNWVTILFSNLKIMLSGWKTYIVCLLMVIYVGIGYFVLGEPFDTTLLLEAFAIAGLRNGVAKN